MASLPTVRASGHPPMFGHLAYIGGTGCIVAHDNQAALIPQMLAERQRRALYAACDRAPDFTPTYRNFFTGGQ